MLLVLNIPLMIDLCRSHVFICGHIAVIIVGTHGDKSNLGFIIVGYAVSNVAVVTCIEDLSNPLRQTLR